MIDYFAFLTLKTLKSMIYSHLTVLLMLFFMQETKNDLFVLKVSKSNYYIFFFLIL